MTKDLWTAVIAFVVTLVLHFGGKYLTPGYFEDVQVVIAAVKLLAAVILIHFYGTAIARAYYAYVGRQ